MPDRNKTCVFVDWCETVVALQRLAKDTRIDFIRLKSWLRSVWSSAEVRYYTGDLQTESERRGNFHGFLKRAGYEVITCKNPYNHQASSAYEDKLRAACHCAMVWDMCNLSQSGRYSSFVLLSGAGQFEQVVDWVKERGINFDVTFFNRLCSETLIRKATRFVEFNLSAVSMRKHPRGVLVEHQYRDKVYA